MRCPLIWLLASVLAIHSAVVAHERNPANTVSIRRWIAQLDADDFSQREQAAAQLARTGRDAIAPLAEGVVSSSPEVAWRCSEILERIAMDGDETTMNQVVKVLTTLARQNRPQLVQFAAQMQARQRVYRHHRAAEEIRRLGGQVAGGDIEVSATELPLVEVASLEDAPEPVAPEPMIEETAPADDLSPAAGDADDAAEAAPPGDAVVIDKSKVENGEGKSKPDVARTTTIFDRLAAGLLPGKVGGALRHALELGSEKKARTDAGEESDLLQLAKDFGLPEVTESGDPLAATPPEEKAEEAIAAADAVEVVDFGVVGVPVFFGGGMVLSDGGMNAGSIALGREWRGGDAGMKNLRDLTGISTLQIEHADLSDAALPQIARMKSLKYVSIRGGKFSGEALRTFHRERPDVSLMAMGEGMMGVNGAFNAGGCILDTVFEGSAAHEAGLRTGDKVLSIEGERIRDFSELTIAVATHRPGDSLRVIYEREGKPHEIDVKLKPRPPGQ